MTSRRARLVLVGCGAIAGLLVAEIALRAGLLGDMLPDPGSDSRTGRWTDHPFLPYIGRPDADYTLRNSSADASTRAERITNNVYGYRSHPFPERKAPGDVHIVCLGGSTTYGWRVADNAETWPEQLEQRLAERYPDRRFRAFNLGLDRANTTFNVVSLALVGVHLEPDIVITYEGFNDLPALGTSHFRTDHAHFYTDLNAESLRPGLLRSVPALLDRSLLARVVMHGVDAITGGNDLSRRISLPRNADRDPLYGIEATLENLRTIHSIAAAGGGRALFATFQFRDPDPAYEAFNDRLREFFRSNRFDFVDQAALIPDGDPAIHSDVCHLTTKGQQMLVDNFFEAIVERDLLPDAQASR